MSFHRILHTILLGAATLGAASAGSLAITFEQPGYTPGNINGQQGWSKTGGYDAVVTNAAGAGGSAQSLRISNGITSGSFGDQTFTPPLGVPAGESTVAGANDQFDVSFDFRPVVDTLQNGLFISVSADNGSGGRMSWLGMGEDAAKGLYLGFYDWNKALNDANQDPWVYQLLASHLDMSVWHNVAVNIEFVDGPGNDVVTVALDGNVIGGGTTWEDFYRYGPTSDGGGGGLFAVDSVLFRAGGTAAPATMGNGFYIDNINAASQTPEPGTVGLALIGVSLVLRRLRKLAATARGRAY